MNLNKMFAGDIVVNSKPTQLLGLGDHIVNNIVGTAAFVTSAGSESDEFADTVDQFKIRIRNAEEQEMDVFISLIGHKRLEELTETDLIGITGKDVQLSNKAWADLPLEDKIAKAFRSYQNNEEEDIAISNVTVTGRTDEDGNELADLQKDCRVIDLARCANARKKVHSLLVVSGAMPEKAKLKDSNQVLNLLNSKEYEFGVNIVAGLRNRKGKTMPRVNHFMASDEVEVG